MPESVDTTLVKDGDANTSLTGASFTNAGVIKPDANVELALVTQSAQAALDFILNKQ